MAGGLALGLSSVGALALAGPAGAQEDPPVEDVQLEGTLSADLVGPGDEVTASSVDNCTVPEEGDAGELWWMVWAFDERADAPEFEDQIPVEADGSWSVTFEAPDAAGDYEFFAVCMPADLPEDEVDELQSMAAQAVTTLGDEGEGPEVPDEPEGGEEEPLTFEYYDLLFTVEGAETPPTEPPAPAPAPPAAAPAQPVAGQPTFTG
jgi:hypothetical protein